MKMPSELQTAFAIHVTSERAASAVYEAMATAFDRLNWTGLSAWARGQSDDETTHARMFIDFLNDRNANSPLAEVPEPGNYFGMQPIAMFRTMLALEQIVTKEIEDLYWQAMTAKDAAATEFLNWFLKEQIGSEKELTVIIGQIEHADNASLLLLDGRLGKE